MINIINLSINRIQFIIGLYDFIFALIYGVSVSIKIRNETKIKNETEIIILNNSTSQLLIQFCSSILF
jgi:hypothetical protein